MGSLKMPDMKSQDMKLTDQIAGHENAKHEFARHDKYRMKIYRRVSCHGNWSPIRGILPRQPAINSLISWHLN